jgi:hypothetical protein
MEISVRDFENGLLKTIFHPNIQPDHWHSLNIQPDHSIFAVIQPDHSQNAHFAIFPRRSVHLHVRGRDYTCSPIFVQTRKCPFIKPFQPQPLTSIRPSQREIIRQNHTTILRSLQRHIIGCWLFFQAFFCLLLLFNLIIFHTLILRSGESNLDVTIQNNFSLDVSNCHFSPCA